MNHLVVIKQLDYEALRRLKQPSAQGALPL